MIAYLDTQVMVWLAEANVAKLSKKALALIRTADLRISPMVLVELQYLHQNRRIVVTPQEILLKLNSEVGVEVCGHPFPIIAEVALGENWTKDPFDRLIVAQAKANGSAPLITKDEAIHAHYANARW